MTKPENISQAIWDEATAVVFEIGESEEHDTLPIALALSQAYSRGLEDAIGAATPYTEVSSLHNYGPGGLSRDEQATMRTARFIIEDIRALGSK